MLLWNISQSKVKGIVRKVGVGFRNGNCGLGAFGGRVGFRRSGRFGRCRVPPSAEGAEGWGTLLLNVV
jgi:hypothetical protein